MTTTAWSALAAVAAVAALFVAVYLGAPGRRIQREQLFDQAVKRALIGDNPKPTSPENPALVDMIRDIWQNQMNGRVDELETRLSDHLHDPYAHERART